MFKGKKLTLIITFLGLYLLSTGTSWAIFSFLGNDPDSIRQVDINGNLRIDPNLPKTEECMINGQMFSEPEREIWEDRRPITAIIENHEESRPQSGLSYADVIYEAVAEGGITRFLTVFYCGASAQDIRISPIRSARVYFINWAQEYMTPIFTHIGGANNICGNCPGGVKPRGQVSSEADAFSLLNRLGWRSAKGNAFDGGTNVGYPIIIRDQYRLGEKAAWEHSVVGFTDKIFEEAKERGYGYKDDSGDSWDENFVSWSFSDDKALSSPKAVEIKFDFWSNKPEYDVSWSYNSQNNNYMRFNGGKEHIDFETKEQLSTKNLLIQFVGEKGPVDEEYHMIYKTVGTGDIILFQNGDVIKGTWSKKTTNSRTMFYDKNGDEISFVRGKIWIEAVPAGNEITY
jgi:hypothetical protein